MQHMNLSGDVYVYMVMVYILETPFMNEKSWVTYQFSLLFDMDVACVVV